MSDTAPTTTKPRNRHSGQFTPLVSGNPRGRPRGPTRPEMIRRKLMRVTHRELEDILDALVEQAKAGDTFAAIGLLDLALTAPIEPDRAA